MKAAEYHPKYVSGEMDLDQVLKSLDEAVSFTPATGHVLQKDFKEYDEKLTAVLNKF